MGAPLDRRLGGKAGRVQREYMVEKSNFPLGVSQCFAPCQRLV